MGFGYQPTQVNSSSEGMHSGRRVRGRVIVAHGLDRQAGICLAEGGSVGAKCCCSSKQFPPHKPVKSICRVPIPIFHPLDHSEQIWTNSSTFKSCLSKRFLISSSMWLDTMQNIFGKHAKCSESLGGCAAQSQKQGLG